MYPKGYLELQMIFAQKMAQLLGISYSESLLRHSDIYGIFGLKWSEDLSLWEVFMAKFSPGELGVDQAYEFYRQRFEQGLIPEFGQGGPIWGCFSYDYDNEVEGVDIHIVDRETLSYGPLSLQRMEVRLAELRDMFLHVLREHPDAERVIGAGTWLLNRVEYRRLFPPEQVPYTWVTAPLLHGTGLWGQFLRRGPRLDEKAATYFLDRVSNLIDPNRMASCFPLQAIQSDGPISNFYRFYGIDVTHGVDTMR